MSRFFLKVLMLGLLSVSLTSIGRAQEPSASMAPAKGDYYSILVAEHRVPSLPEEPLYWKIESFPTLEAASSASASDYALAASIADRSWLFTLGAKGAAGHGGTAIAEIGPIAPPRAKSFVLRVNHAGGPPGSRTAAYTQVGSEAIYLLSGQISRRTARGLIIGEAGDVLNGNAPETTIQTMSTGAADLEQIVLSVLAADQP